MLENTAGSGVLEHVLSALSAVFCVMAPVAGGGLERPNPAKTKTHSGIGVKETHNFMLWEPKICKTSGSYWMFLNI